MSHALIKASLAAPVLSEEMLRRPPKVVERSGRRAVEVWVDFFTAAFANDNTRAAYKRGLHEFFQFVERNPMPRSTRSRLGWWPPGARVADQRASA